ncbi:MAG: electron transfer flavoprotein subunit beta/FixA family protein [Melioribacteraceae bacterium]|nr:electron transfer flavoprotein subunit beta/FixA family protein [Melioribacteraceae bacterium]
MKLVVCVSYVPDTASKINVSLDGKTIEQAGVTYILNPYDEFAIEEALKLKEKFGGEVDIISLGGDKNKESIQKALAMGADNGILLKDDSYRDSVAIAFGLAEEIKTLNADVVLFGKQSVDYDNGIIGQLTAELLGFNCVSVVTKLDITDNKVTAEREIEGGKEIVSTSLPVVITGQKGLNEPRYASLKGIMAAKKKVITEKTPVQFESKVLIDGFTKPASKQAGKIIGTDASAAAELVRLLKDEAKVI